MPRARVPFLILRRGTTEEPRRCWKSCQPRALPQEHANQVETAGDCRDSRVIDGRYFVLAHNIDTDHIIPTVPHSRAEFPKSPMIGRFAPNKT